MKIPTPSSTISPGRGLAIARAAGVAVALLAVTLSVVGLPTLYGEYRSLSSFDVGDRNEAYANLAQLGLSVDFYAGYQVALGVAFVAACLALATIIFVRRSDEPIALFVSLVLVLLGTAFLSPLSEPAIEPEALGLILSGLGHFRDSLYDTCLLLFFYLFPDGRFVPRWTRWLAVLLIVWLVLMSFPGSLFNPVYWPEWLASAVGMGWLFTGGIAQIYRYRSVAGPLERQQTKWVVSGFMLALVGFLALKSLNDIFPSLQPGSLTDLLITTAVYCFMLLIPLSLAIAILRYRLWDIDILINRTLVYGTLTATLALVYYLGVVLLQALLRGATGQESSLAVVASTLTVAVLFMPLRRRIRTFIDRSFYRTKYDSRKTLEAFGARVRDEADLQKLSEALVEVVDETMKPSHVSLWLRPPPKKNKP
jgi:hypothetical protein